MNTPKPQLRPSLQKRIEAIMDERDNLLNRNIQLTNIVDRLTVEWDKLAADLYELKGRIVKADATLERLGYRHCDIPACNCNGYHRTDTAELRLQKEAE